MHIQQVKVSKLGYYYETYGIVVLIYNKPVEADSR